ncbi:MAG TPA: NifU family protein [Candidatus Megaira endosymbiont of Hartmannula sinica]|nr:NifU family protein [Candidatus Megaera endosymbiont of Hartmannula sinica]
MYIETVETPNYNALKFCLPKEITQSPVFYNNEQEAIESSQRSDLALMLFSLEDVEAVFYGRDFITVTKSENANWDFIKSSILSIISDYLVQNKPIFTEAGDLDASKNNITNSDSDVEAKEKKQVYTEIEKQIIELIDTRIRPSVMMDGGDISYKGFKDGIVFLELRGACSGCPSASITLNQGIKSMLMHFISEVTDIKAIND